MPKNLSCFINNHMRVGVRYVKDYCLFFARLFREMYKLFIELSTKCFHLIKRTKPYSYDTKEKFKNLYGTNLSLGLHHYYHKRYKEAKFRFFLMKIFLKDEYHRSEVDFNLARCALMLDDREHCNKLLKKITNTDDFLKDVIQYYLDGIKGQWNDCPVTLRMEEMLYSHECYAFDSIAVKGYNVDQEIISLIQTHFTLPQSNLTILDVGSRLGYNGISLRKLSFVSCLLGVEFVEEFVDYTMQLMQDTDTDAQDEEEPKTIYDNMFITNAYLTVFTNDIPLVDCVLLNDLFYYIRDIDQAIQHYAQYLKVDGLLYFYLKEDSQTELGIGDIRHNISNVINTLNEKKVLLETKDAIDTFGEKVTLFCCKKL